MSEVKRIMDVGIGRGGIYLTQDCLGTRRIGVDKYVKDLTICREDYQLEVCAVGEDTLLNQGFPFLDESFARVEFYFPFDELLYGLGEPRTNFWSELARVLQPKGTVQIITEIPYPKQVVKVGDKRLEMDKPELVIVDCAEQIGFETSVQYMRPPALRKIGTYHTVRAADWVERGFRLLYNPKVAKITAQKA